MEIFLRFLALVFFTTTTAFAQLSDGSTAPNFTIRDTDGNEHDLYSILDEGKPVLLDLFATWCGPCWSFAQAGVFEVFNAAYGPEGTDEVLTIAIESDAGTPASELSGGGNSIGDWTSIIGYPLADDATGAIAEAYGLAYYPTIYLICPDRTITQIGQGPNDTSMWTPYGLYEKISNSCGVELLPPFVVEGVNSSVISCDNDLVNCGDDKVNPILTIMNLGTEVMTACTINTIVEEVVVSSFEWTGSLETYAAEQITLTELPSNITDVSFEVVMAADVRASDNNIDVVVASATESHAYVYVQVNTDFYPGETSWEILDFNGTVVMSDSYESGNQDQLGGGGPDARMTHNYFESLEEGCYAFKSLDAWGDGQYDGEVEGSIVVTDGEGLELLRISGNWGAKQSAYFEVTHGVGIEEVSENSISIFPNPASSKATVALNLSESDDVAVEVVNTLGQQVFVQTSKMNAGQNTVEIPVEKLIIGMYYVNIKIGNEVSIEKLNIMK